MRFAAGFVLAALLGALAITAVVVWNLNSWVALVLGAAAGAGGVLVGYWTWVKLVDKES